MTATIRSLLPLTAFHSSHIMSSKVQSATLYLANKCDGTGDRYSFTLQKRRKSMWPISTDDKCMSPSQNHLSRLPSSSWLMKTRLNEFEKPQIYCIKYIKLKDKGRMRGVSNTATFYITILYWFVEAKDWLIFFFFWEIAYHSETLSLWEV